jgi:outer membrane immunogenic protein
MKIVIAAIVLTISSVAALAADLGLRKTYPASQETLASTKASWTGAYAGLNGGWVSGDTSDLYVTPAFGKIGSAGGLGGAQVGYNHQFGDFVLGVEADYALARADGDKRLPNIQNFGVYKLTGSAEIRSSLESFGSVRARAGVAMNSALIYASAGYAFGRNKITASGSGTYTDNNVTSSDVAAGKSSNWMNGWAVGAGVEYAFSQHLSGKVEYLHADLQKATIFKDSWAEDRILTKFNILRAGVNYRF